MDGEAVPTAVDPNIAELGDPIRTRDSRRLDGCQGGTRAGRRSEREEDVRARDRGGARIEHLHRHVEDLPGHDTDRRGNGHRRRQPRVDRDAESRVADCDGFKESLTRAMKSNVPATSGAPVIAPPEESVRPAGRLPDAMLKW